MARPFVELYINNQKVYFKEPPEIFVTYAHTDLHNPTVVKNSYTKTITVEGTPENNRIFNNFYDMRRMNGDGLFNPSRKETFTLYRNGEPIETGYVKLDKVDKKNGRITYNITLFGGLGQFLYNLQYKEDGEQMRLSDLEYNTSFDFTIDRNTVRDAWKHLTDPNPNVVRTPYDIINFAPCYNGIPENFTADKVAIYADDMNVDLGIYTESEGYTAIDGWVIGELNKEYDEWQTKDLRSYLQRPVVRFKEIIEACCKPDNNGGYTVDLDSDFFNDNNPYYENAWMTLPMLNELTEVEDSELKDSNISVNNGKITIDGCNPYTRYNVSIPMTINLITENNTSNVMSSSVFIKCSGNFDTGNSKGTTSASVTDYGTVYYAQLVAYNAADEAVAGSQVIVFGGTLFNENDYLEGVYKFEPIFKTSYEKAFALWYKQDNGTYNFGDAADYLLTINDLEYEDGMYFKVILKEAENTYDWRDIDYTDNQGYFYQSTEYIWTQQGNTTTNDCQTLVDAKLENEKINGAAFPLITSNGYIEQKYDVNERKVTKKTLLNSEATPCDYFLSYIKMFNLHIWKDMYENKIYVRMRKNFFNSEIKDLEDWIDRGENITITPLTFKNKWLNFSTEYEEDEKLHKAYHNEYGLKYGMQKIDTNYSFDNSSTDVLENFVFKGAITTRAKSKYYVDIYNNKNDLRSIPSAFMDGCQTYLFNGEGDTKEGKYITPKTTAMAIKWWKRLYYDMFPKPSFADEDNAAVDGANVLLFFNGVAELRDVNDKWAGFHITDDIPQFEQLNEGEPCWIYMATNYTDIAIPISRIPMFGRYLVNENNWITHSWDFGTPKSLYIPDYNIDDTSSIYTQYWKPYIRDQYDSNTRVVECRVLLKERVIGDWLQRFYYWDGRYWILNKISDYNPSSNGTTKCEFVSVNDINNYLS